MLKSKLLALDPRSSWIGLLISAGVALTVLLTLLEPASSAGLSPIQRLLFWGAHVAVPLALAQLVQTALTARSTLSPMASVVLSGLIAGLLFVPFAAGLDALFPVSDRVDDAGEAASVAILEETLSLVPPVMLVWIALNGLRGVRLTSAAPTGDPDQPAFLDRVRPELRGRVIALSAELHYLRVRTERGEDLILYSFGQAVDDMAKTDPGGIQLHRSHWVAWSDGLRSQRRGRNLFVLLADGTEIPVARARTAEALEWLDPRGKT